MSMGSSWQQFSNASPPERGSFPLDFNRLCTKHVTAYMDCLKANKGEAGRCKEASKVYLQCRMNNKLMEKEDMKDLGFKET